MSAPVAKDASTQGSLAWGSKEIRTLRKAITTYCTGCGKSEEELGGGRPLRKCGKCHSAMYCSEKCQTRDWPEHKGTCREETRISKLIQSLMVNPLLMKQLHSCFILAFDLLDRARTDEVLCAQLDVAIEPSDILDFAHLLLGSEEGSFEKKTRGMLQLNAFTPDTTGLFAGQREAAWRQERALADAAGNRDSAVAILDVVHENSQRAMCIHLQISSEPMFRESIRKWKTEGFPMIGQTTRVPYTTEICLELMNTYIRADSLKDNKFLLRTQMQPSDIRAIRDCPSISASNRPAALLHAKIAREHIYREIYQEFLRRRKVATGVIPTVPVVKGFRNMEVEDR
ncbi:hypothetical protein MSAN_02085800 [Mycena sanguinolenta]|uniref:MYND-type domain-containing protein n=1 Tax=Mycena sanguinolenta TaxID=230812 RepID=A0A8H7CKF8_9AGAR|nr:hypothetical protein MSAN_02085800 [Mycena sanguinolenta]